MALVVALVPDLLFGSRVQGSLALAGHEVELIADESGLLGRIADRTLPVADLLVVDLTGDLDGAQILGSLAADEACVATRTLAFYSHVDAAARERAEQAGFDLVVPRSRMAREGPQLVERLVGA
jgi:hypothetical protein